MDQWILITNFIHVVQVPLFCDVIISTWCVGLLQQEEREQEQWVRYFLIKVHPGSSLYHFYASY